MSRRTPAPRRGGQAGFTLLETMLALGILVTGLTVLINATAENVRTAERADMLGIATELSRGKMYDVEEKLIHDGFPEVNPPDEEDDFGEDGWKDFSYVIKIEKVELPNLASLQAIEGATGENGEASGEPTEGGATGLAQSPLAGLIAMGGGDAQAAAGAGFIESQFELVRQVLEAAIRKVTLTVTWKAGGWDEKLVTVCYFTDPAAMNKVLSGLPLNSGGARAPRGGTTR